MITDTHTHLYSKDFDEDRDEVILNAINSGIEKLFLPNIDLDSIEGMQALAEKYPNLALEWNYTKNFPLVPEQFHPKSGKKVWWKCDQA